MTKMAQLLKENLGYNVFINKKNELFHNIIANTMQYKYQEVSCNFLPNLGTIYIWHGETHSLLSSYKL